VIIKLNEEKGESSYLKDRNRTVLKNKGATLYNIKNLDIRYF